MLEKPLVIGLARMHKEPGERRDFLPSFAGHLDRLGAQVILEYGYGCRLGYTEDEYLEAAPGACFAAQEEVYGADVVLVLRYPAPEYLDMLRCGGTLVSMVHYPTRPDRVDDLRRRGLEAVSLDSVVDDSNRRLVENLRAVAWNGVQAAFQVLTATYPAPGFASSKRPPIQVTLLGAGAVGSFVVQAATRYGDEDFRKRLVKANVPGVIVNVVDYDTTPLEPVMLDLLRRTDILIDATQRPDPSRVVIPNRWIGIMPEHAVLLDLSVDPYDCTSDRPIFKGIEGIPQGNLNQYVFAPDDPAWERTVPACVDTTHRRWAVSCYSWPGIYPRQCMQVYGRQIAPLMRTLINAGGAANINERGTYFHRAVARAMLSKLHNNNER